ncbi:hypothetical protein [Streptomyces sp. NPDC090445]
MKGTFTDAVCGVAALRLRRRAMTAMTAMTAAAPTAAAVPGV